MYILLLTMVEEKYIPKNKNLQQVIHNFQSTALGPHPFEEVNYPTKKIIAVQFNTEGPSR